MDSRRTRKLRTLSRHMRQNAVAWLALFVALGGTSAFAANTVFSTDIVDGEVKSVDIGNNEIGSADVKDNTINTFDVHSFLGVDVVDGTLTGADLANGAVTADKLGTDVQPAVKFTAPRGAFTSGVSPFVAGTRLSFVCTDFRLQVKFQNLTGTQGTITATYVRTGPTPTLVRLADDNGGEGVIWLDTQDNVGGTGNEGGAGTLVWTNGTRVVSGEFSYLADAGHCEFYGTMHAGT